MSLIFFPSVNTGSFPSNWKYSELETRVNETQYVCNTFFRADYRYRTASESRHLLASGYVAGPGHGGPAVIGNTYLEGTYSEAYPDICQDEVGLQKLFK